MHEQRKFCLNALRKLGLGKTQMNEYVTKEALELVKRIKLKCKVN